MLTENVKYYGFIYEGYGAHYDFKKNNVEFDDPHDALKNANDKWNKNPDLQIPRLLVVLKQEMSIGNKIITKYAFFQFSDSEACETFILNKKEIFWSKENEQIWNGNAHFMTSSNNKP